MIAGVMIIIVVIVVSLHEFCVHESTLEAPIIVRE